MLWYVSKLANPYLQRVSRLVWYTTCQALMQQYFAYIMGPFWCLQKGRSMSCVPCVAICDTARHKAAFVVAACPGYDGPNGAKQSVEGVERQPLLLIHGISLSSTSWVVNGRDESLGFVLADEGYDVWVALGGLSFPYSPSCWPPIMQEIIYDNNLKQLFSACITFITCLYCLREPLLPA